MVRKGNRAHRFFLSLIVALSVCFLSYGLSLAAGGHEGVDRSGDLIDLLKRFLNFALLIIILFWAFRKSGIKGFFTSRTEEIGQNLDALKEEKAEAEKKYKDIEKKLSEFETKRKDILEQYKAEGLSEKDRIIAEAQVRVKTIIEQAELTIQQEIQAARDRLKKEVVGLASQKAREIITKEMTEKDQDHLVDEFIERVEKLH